MRIVNLQVRDSDFNLGIDGTRTAYFRGRKLHGKTVKLPDGYRGVVVEKSEPRSATTTEPEPDVVDLVQEDGEGQVPLGGLETKAEFEELVVWGHEAMADAASDPYVRIEEWTRLAEQVDSCSVLETSGYILTSAR